MDQQDMRVRNPHDRPECEQDPQGPLLTGQRDECDCQSGGEVSPCEALVEGHLGWRGVGDAEDGRD